MSSDAATDELAEDPDPFTIPRPTAAQEAPSSLSDRVAAWVFAIAVVVAFPLIIGRLGAYHWFLRDDWEFLTTADDLTIAGLFEPHNTHFSVVPRAVFAALWRLFGVTSYTPYQGLVVALHLTVVVLVRVIMRRSGVGPWLATAAAGALLLFGPGSQDITWAFQIGFTGAIAFGLAAVVLADHDGPLAPRDAAAVGAALLGMMSSGSAVPLLLALGGVTLLRRGWKVAAALAVPLAAVYLLWIAIEHPSSGPSFSKPGPTDLARWIWSGMVGTLEGLGHWTVVAVLLAVVGIVGVALEWAPWSRGGGLVRRIMPPPTLVTPLVLFVASLSFSAITGWGRWFLGPDGARASRYLYLLAALTLPLLAVGAQAVVTRQHLLLVPVCALFLVAVPHNAGSFEPTTAFGRHYMAERERIATTAVRMSFADDVPPHVRPEPDVYDGELTIGFLLDAVEAGRLEPSTEPLTDSIENEFRVRLGIDQGPVTAFPSSCEEHIEPVDLSPSVGDQLIIATPVVLMTIDEDGDITSPLVARRPAEGPVLTAVLPDLDLRVARARGAPSFTICEP